MLLVVFPSSICRGSVVFVVVGHEITTHVTSCPYFVSRVIFICAKLRIAKAIDVQLTFEPPPHIVSDVDITPFSFWY